MVLAPGGGASVDLPRPDCGLTLGPALSPALGLALGLPSSSLASPLSSPLSSPRWLPPPCPLGPEPTARRLVPRALPSPSSAAPHSFHQVSPKKQASRCHRCVTGKTGIIPSSPLRIALTGCALGPAWPFVISGPLAAVATALSQLCM